MRSLKICWADALLPSLLLCSALMPAAQGSAAINVQIDPPVLGPDVGQLILQRLYPDRQQPQLAQALQAQLSGELGTLSSSLRDQINEKLGNLGTHEFLAAMGNAAASASRNLGVDYASDPSVASLSFGAGASINRFSLTDLSDPEKLTASAQEGRLPARGLAPSAAVTLHLNLRPLDLPRWRFFDPGRLNVALSVMRLNPRSFSKVTVAYQTIGVRAAYDLIPTHALVSRGVVRWGGLTLGAGVARSTASIDISSKLPDADVSSNLSGDLPLTARMQFSGAATLNAKSQVTTVPIELWTNAQILYFLTVYGGGAIDFNFGSASLSIDANQKAQAQAFNSDNPSLAPVTLGQASAIIDADDRASPQTSNLRAFAGLQVNLLAMALFAQGSFDTAANLSVTGGIRAFW